MSIDALVGDRQAHARAALESYRAVIPRLGEVIEQESLRFGRRRYPTKRSAAVPFPDAGFRCCFVSGVTLEVPFDVALLMREMECGEIEVAQSHGQQWLRRVPVGDILSPR